MDVGRLLLISKMKKRSILAKKKQNIFFLNFIYFEHKHVETGLNCTHGLSIFLKFHMPLR